MASPEEIAIANQNYPNFASMSPAEQESIIRQIRIQVASQKQAQQRQSGGVTNEAKPSVMDTVSQVAVPALALGAGYSGLSKLVTGGLGSSTAAAAAPSITSTGLSSGGAAAGVQSGAIAPATTSLIGPGLGVLGAGLSGADLIKRFGQGDAKGSAVSGAGLGAGITAALPALGVTGIGLPAVLAGGAAGALLGAGLGSIKTGKHKDQVARDQSRSVAQQLGIYDGDYNLTLSDGTKIDMGLDGSKGRYNVDFTIPGMEKAVAYAAPLGWILGQGNEKRANDITGELANAIYNSKDPMGEVKRLFEQAGLYKEPVLEYINSLKLGDDVKKVLSNTVGQLGIKSAPTQGGQGGIPPGMGGGGIKIVMNQPAPVKVQEPDNRKQMAYGILSNMLSNKQVYQYPTQAKGQGGVTNAFSKILGGVNGQQG